MACGSGSETATHVEHTGNFFVSDLKLAAQRVRDLRLSSLEPTFESAKRVFDISSFSGPCHAADGLAHVRSRSEELELEKNKNPVVPIQVNIGIPEGHGSVESEERDIDKSIKKQNISNNNSMLDTLQIEI